MKVLFELENEQDVKSIEKMMKKIKISNIEKHDRFRPEQKIKGILDFANKHALKVSRVEIPSREERNAR